MPCWVEEGDDEELLLESSVGIIDRLRQSREDVEREGTCL